MKRTTLLLLLLSYLFLNSCSIFYDNNLYSIKYYQLYEIAPMEDSLKSEYTQYDDLMIYTDDNCSIFYKFWSEEGNSAFIFKNNSDEEIVLDLSRCFFILNGRMNYYYKGNTYNYTDLSTMKSNQLIESKNQIVLPNAYIEIKGFPISESIYRRCGFPTNPKKKEIAKKQFNAENSPISFSNIITYYKGGCKKNINNLFYISSIQNIKESSIVRYEDSYDCNGDVISKADYKVIDHLPNMFYNIYIFSDGDLDYRIDEDLIDVKKKKTKVQEEYDSDEEYGVKMNKWPPM